MKSFIENIKKYISSISLKPKKSSEYKTISDKANHDWRLMLLLFIFFVIGVVFLDAFIFVKASKGEIFLAVEKSEEARAPLSEKRLGDAVEQFESRRKNLEGLKLNPPTTTDPSL